MADKIYLDELDCPHCDWGFFNESWEIEVEQDRRVVTGVICGNCGKEFYVHTDLQISVTKEKNNG